MRPTTKPIWMPRLNLKSEGKMSFVTQPLERFSTAADPCTCGQTRIVKRKHGGHGCLRCGKDREAA